MAEGAAGTGGVGSGAAAAALSPHLGAQGNRPPVGDAAGHPQARQALPALSCWQVT